MKRKGRVKRANFSVPRRKLKKGANLLIARPWREKVEGTIIGVKRNDPRGVTLKPFLRGTLRRGRMPWMDRDFARIITFLVPSGNSTRLRSDVRSNPAQRHIPLVWNAFLARRYIPDAFFFNVTVAIIISRIPGDPNSKLEFWSSRSTVDIVDYGPGAFRAWQFFKFSNWKLWYQLTIKRQ